jgi:uncharacterized protein
LSTVSNTSPLIWLAKIGKLTLLKDLFGEVFIPEESYNEAVEKGLKEGYSDALVIKNACDQGWIKVKQLDENQVAVYKNILQGSFELHAGEAQAVVLAHDLGKDAVLLMDDSSGRAFAETWGIKVKGTLYVVLAALRKGLLSKQEAKDTVYALVFKGFRIEPKLLAKVIEAIEKE